MIKRQSFGSIWAPIDICISAMVSRLLYLIEIKRLIRGVQICACLMSYPVLI